MLRNEPETVFPVLEIRAGRWEIIMVVLKKTTLFWTVCLVFACFHTGLPAQQGKKDAGPPTVRVEPVGFLSSSQPKAFVGFVTAKETVTLVPRVSGFLEKIDFQEGSTVNKGDPLFEIEETTYKFRVQIAQSVIKQIEAEIELAKKDIDRIQTLRSRDVVTEQDLNQAQRTVNLQEAKLDEAKAALALAENDLSYTKIHAPLTGRIGAKSWSQGNYITPTSGTLATIVQYDPITIKFSISEPEYLVYFGNDDSKNLNIEILKADNQPYTGECKVDFVDNVVDTQTGTITIYLICENKKNQLLPGGYARVRLSETYGERFPAVGMESILIDGTETYVYVLGEKNIVERRRVTLGQLVVNRYIVKSGLTIDEQIVVSGINKIGPGTEVRPQ